MCNYATDKSGIIFRQYINDIIKELIRKTIHLCAAFIPLLLNHFFYPVVVLLFIVLVIYLIAETLRCNGKSVPLISEITQVASRKRDENKFVLGPVTLTVGILITSLCFDLESASVGIYALALGDGFASLIGKLFGKNFIRYTNGKTVEGSLACFLAIFLSCFLVSKNALMSLFIATLGMLIEVLPLKDFDNLLIPILLAAVYHFHM